MAQTMQFDLVSPERRLASLQATQVQIPAAEGDMTAMPDHAPVITTLRPGVVTVSGADGAETRYAVTGGFAEITSTGMSVLAERAFSDFKGSRADVEAHIEAARGHADSLEGDHRDLAEKMVADLVQLLEDME